MSDKRIDLEPLAPWPDEKGFLDVVQSVTRRAVTERNQRASYTFQLNALVKPALALAASIAIVVWIGAFATGEPSSEERTVPKKDPAFELASWAMTGTVPSTSEIIQTLGGSDE